MVEKPSSRLRVTIPSFHKSFSFSDYFVRETGCGIVATVLFFLFIFDCPRARYSPHSVASAIVISFFEYVGLYRNADDPLAFDLALRIGSVPQRNRLARRYNVLTKTAAAVTKHAVRNNTYVHIVYVHA